MSLFKKPNELEVNSNIKMLVYGQPGMGKSTIALSAPNPVMLDFDGGVNRVNGAFQCPTLQVKNWEQVNEALNEDLSEYNTIIIDTVGKMMDFMGAYIMKNDPKMRQRDGSLSLKGYGARKTLFQSFVSRVSMMNMNLVFVGHDSEEKDGDRRYIRPEIGGSSSKDLMKELDLVGYMQVEGNDRVITFGKNEDFYTKKIDSISPKYKVSTIINEKGEITGKNNFLSLIFETYNRYMKEQGDKKNKYANLISSIEDDINAIEDLESANFVLEKIRGYEPIFDSKIRAGVMINDKCKSLNFKYNKVTDKYEVAG